MPDLAFSSPVSRAGDVEPGFAFAPQPVGATAAPPVPVATAIDTFPARARARLPLASLDDRDTAIAEAAWRFGVEPP
jgi:hypothetical protein